MSENNEKNLNPPPLINLNNISEEGGLFCFDADELSRTPNLENISTIDAENFVKIKITPIGDTHFEVKASIKLKRPMNCSKCGEDFKAWFNEDVTEYLSLETQEEGEDQGFLLLESPNWDWATFINESVELETPYQNYKYGKKCLVSCAHYDEAIKKGWITKEKNNKNPFQALEKLKNKLN